MVYQKKSIIGLITGLAIMSSSIIVAAEAGKQLSTIELGKKLAFTRKKGNCLACHMIVGGESPGTIAPPLIAMKSRYPDKATLKEQIWDASLKNPETIMPVFGRFEVLTDKEINQLVDYIYSL
ncbi:MAG: sulfur oxidation c-type cytochrome SoxX [Pseudomonadota bacterium]